MMGNKGMEAIPCDLIIEILSRLPVKELGKLSCVCKQWYRLLTHNKEFTAQHMKYTKRKHLLLLRKYSSNFFMEVKKNKVTVELKAINMEGTVINKFATVINSPVHTFVSSGALAILCCMNSLYVFNPSTGEVVSMPCSSAAASFYTIGFGYLPRSNEYKIIHLFFTPCVGDAKMGSEILTLRDGEGVTGDSWRSVGTCPRIVSASDCLCVNGSVFWEISRPCNGSQGKEIVSFDLEKEEFKVIELLEPRNISPMNQFSIQDKVLKAEEEQRRRFQMVEVKGIGYLPRDLIIEILSRLPAKDLCRLRCVSKSWNELLTRDMEFIARHIEWSKQKPLLLVRRYISDGTGELNKSKITIELTSIDMQGDVTDKFRKVIDGPVHTFVSCGPLSILCCMYSLYVCNPSIRQVVHVPYRSNSRLYNIGFGYLPVSNEYKIIHMFYHSFVGNGKMGCEIFSFRTGEGVSSGSWRKIGDCPFSAWTDEYPVCVDGTIYWGLSSGWKDKSILSLDLEKEEFSSISYPIHESKTYSFLEYIGLMGALCVVGFSAEASTIDIWMLKDIRKKIWTIEYSINLFPLCPKFLIPSDDQSEEILVHMEQRDIICYSLKSQISRRIGYYRAMKTYNKPCLYYDSLISMRSTGT